MVWFGLKKSLQCRSEAGEVHDPSLRDKTSSSGISTRKTTTIRSGCSRSIANLKDVVVHGSKRYNVVMVEKPYLESPRSIGSNELANPISHEVVLNNSTCELKITSYSGGGGGGSGSDSGKNGGGSGSPFVCTLKPGTPGPGVHYRTTAGAKSSFGSLSGFSGIVSNKPRGFNNGSYKELSCPKCGEQFSKCEAVESHHLSKHAVTQLVEGDSARSIVEMICRTSWSSKIDNNKNNNNINNNGIDRILKVHNMQKTLARFEEHRETVKIKASKLAKKHARCLADGNELLRFHGTTIECSLGKNNSSGLCNSDNCNVCQILRHGFKPKKGGVGVFTTSTSGKALEAIEMKGRMGNSCDNKSAGLKKALIVCRVIAGRVHKPMENLQELVGFDSLAGKLGIHSTIEELFLLNPRALLPCFVVIFR